MGGVILRCAMADPRCLVTSTSTRPSSKKVGVDISEILGGTPTGIEITASPLELFDNADIVIDFSNPELSVEHARSAAASKKPLVIGTTGFLDSHKDKIRYYSSETPILLAPNMSYGAALLEKLAAFCAAQLNHTWDITIIDAHHKRKADLPSGTALSMVDAIANASHIQHDSGLAPINLDPAVQIISLRAGTIVGDHWIVFAGPNERIEIVHRAENRQAFALGAIEAANWLLMRSPGLYSMADVGISLNN